MTSAPATPESGKADAGSRARSAARLGAVQALYQMDVAATDLDNAVDEFLGMQIENSLEDQDSPLVLPDEAHFESIVRGVVREQRDIDQELNASLAKGWTLARLDSTLRAILRAGAYEMRHCKDVPLKVVINEYVDVAHAFFEGDEPGVVNAVLDRIGRSVRGSQTGAGHGASGDA
jgi:N utilization substance protein B